VGILGNAELLHVNFRGLRERVAGSKSSSLDLWLGRDKFVFGGFFFFLEMA
jgi:hypothetical protein